MPLLGLLAAVVIGLTLGLLGGGGSILTVPVFVYLLGFGAKQAIAMSLIVVGSSALVGAVSHWRAGNVNLPVALLFGGVAMVGTYLGARLAVFFTGAQQLTLFALTMLVAAYFMSRGKPAPESPAPLARSFTGAAALLIIAEGLAVGVLTGLVGVGGGFLIVPALVLLGKLPMKQAVGTSLVVIVLNSAAGSAGYLGQVEIPWDFVALFSALAALGIAAGTYLMRYVPQHALKRGFAVFLVLMGAFILYQNRAALLQAPLSAQQLSEPRTSER